MKVWPEEPVFRTGSPWGPLEEACDRSGKSLGSSCMPVTEGVLDTASSTA